MFTELPKLFERNFFIGYFLPASVFLAASSTLLSKFNLGIKIIPLFSKDPLASTAIFTLLSWLLGVTLLALNRDIYKLLEGYGKYNPFHFISRIEKRYYKKLKQDLDILDKQYERAIKKNNQSNNESEITQITRKRAKIIRILVERFPDDEAYLLPTAFGNTIRAFEVYSRVMYGLDAIPGWDRLLTVIPKDYRILIDDAKAQTDFWLHLWILSILFIIEYLFVCIYSNQYKLVWVLVISILFAFFTSSKARVAALEWGNYIKASFDIFLPELYKKLEFQYPLNRNEERKNWETFSQAVIYRYKSLVHSRYLPKNKQNKEE